MDLQQSNYSIKPVTVENKHLLNAFPNYINIADKDHGVSVSYITSDNDKVILGLAGLNYSIDAQLYEVIINILPVYSQELSSYELLENIVTEAFDTLYIDKVCARAIPGSDMDTLYRTFGFSHLGERMFTDEQTSVIYYYYELENDNLLDTTSETQSPAYKSDWDNIF